MSETLELLAFGRVGLGTFPFSGAFGPVSEQEAAETLAAHLGSGGRYVETAPSYGEGAVRLAKLLADYPRDRYLIGTKCVTGRDRSGRIFASGRRDHVLAQCHGELERLGVDHLDVLQMHHLATDAPPEETMHALAELRDQGLVRWIGLSNVTLAQLGLFAQAGEIDVVQNRLSVVHDGGHAELVPYCRALGIAFNPYQAIERGLLTGGRDRLFIRRSDDIRRGKPEYSGRPFRLIRAWYEDTVLSIAERHDLPAERLVVGWALSRQCVVCCVLGARTPLQARRNVEAGEPAPPAALAELDQARRALAHEIERTQGVDLATFRGLDSGLLSQEHITTPLHGRRAFS